MVMAKPKKDKPTAEDIGAALIRWYAEALQEYPDGLVTQAQVATMLGISRMAVSRLVARGYLRAVYFPKPPDVVGVSIGYDDPTWLKVIGWLSIKSGDADTYAFPKACYVSFADVVRLWQDSDAKKKCKRDWNEIVAVMQPHAKYVTALNESQSEKRKAASKERG